MFFYGGVIQGSYQTRLGNYFCITKHRFQFHNLDNFVVHWVISVTPISLYHFWQNYHKTGWCKSGSSVGWLSFPKFFIFLLFSVTQSSNSALLFLRQILAAESPLKMIKNAFHFTLKVLFVLKIYTFLSRIFSHVEK